MHRWKLVFDECMSQRWIYISKWGILQKLFKFYCLNHKQDYWKIFISDWVTGDVWYWLQFDILSEGQQELELIPAGTWRLNNVVLTSMQHDVTSTLMQRCINVMTLHRRSDVVKTSWRCIDVSAMTCAPRRPATPIPSLGRRPVYRVSSSLRPFL